MAARDRPEWVLVCGGFHARGGMDLANAALAEYLADTGARVHLVAHDVAPALAAREGVVTHVAPRPGGSVLAGELALDALSARVARERRRAGRPVVVLANGGNVLHGDVNWVHSVHHAWAPADAGAPAWFKAKNRAVRWWYRRRERLALSRARLVITNSERTRREVVTHLGVDADRTRTVYLGSAPGWQAPSAADRGRARRAWLRDPSRPLLAFVGALGHDANKGIDTLLAAWGRLRQDTGWNAELVVAGPGRTARWRRVAGAGGDVRFVGLTDRVGELLDAADLLVSPVRYEAYGLAMHEGLCRGVPVLTSAQAGIVERFRGVDDLLLTRAGDPDELVAKLLDWRRDPQAWRERFRGAGAELAGRSMRDMAKEIVDLVTASRDAEAW